VREREGKDEECEADEAARELGLLRLRDVRLVRLLDLRRQPRALKAVGVLALVQQQVAHLLVHFHRQPDALADEARVLRARSDDVAELAEGQLVAVGLELGGAINLGAIDFRLGLLPRDRLERIRPALL
jgi:hypothetical protein